MTTRKMVDPWQGDESMTEQPALAEFDPEAVYHDDENPVEPIGLPNEDWLRGMAWDVWVNVGGVQRLVSNLAELKLSLAQTFEDEHDGISPAKDATVQQFLAWPSALAMPDGLRQELMRDGFAPPKKPTPAP